jgi:hypothetical protein
MPGRGRVFNAQTFESDVTVNGSVVTVGTVNGRDIAADAAHITSTVNPHSVTKTQVGLGNVLDVIQIPASEKGVANGVASLNGSGKVPANQLSLSNVDYVGTWNASTNDPALADGVGTQGNYYVVSTSGSTSIDGITDWVSGDWIIFNGSVWQKSDNTDQVTSVAGRSGVVTLFGADITDFSSVFTTNFATKATTDLTEGTNLYYTEARVNANSTVVANVAHKDTSSGNPHSVTHTEVGSATAQWNASKFQGVDVSSDTVTNKDILRYDSTSSKFELFKAYDEDLSAQFEDDFYGSELSKLWLVGSDGETSTIDLFDSIGGQVQLTSGTTVSNYMELKTDKTAVTSASNASMKFRLKLSHTTNTTVTMGAIADADHYVQFIYDNSTAGNWKCKIKDSISTEAEFDALVVGDLSWHIFEIKMSSSSIDFYIDGVLKATIPGIIPTPNMKIFVNQTAKTVDSRNILLDYVKVIGDREA